MTIEPTRADIEAARASVRVLEDALRSDVPRVANGLVQFSALQLPEAVVPLLMRLLSEVAEGHRVKIEPVLREPLSTTEAAEMLNISRPTLINLLESGDIRYHMVGTHRRIARDSLLAYKRRMEAGEAATARPAREDRIRGLREMTETGIEAGEAY